MGIFIHPRRKKIAFKLRFLFLSSPHPISTLQRRTFTKNEDTMRGAVGIVVCSLGAAAALQPALCPTVRAARGNAPAVTMSVVDRRSAVLGALGWGLLAAPAFAYDAIPEVSADFEALEKARVLEAASDKLKSKELNVKVAKIEAATTPQEFPLVRPSAYSAGSTIW